MKVNKSKLLNFILKYNLDAGASGKADNAVKIEANSDSISTSFISEDKSLLGKVRFTDINFPAGTYGVYETTKLESIVKIMQDEFDLDVEESLSNTVHSLTLKDSTFNASFVLANLDIIPVPPTLKSEPEFDASFVITRIFADNVVKARKAMTDASVLAFTVKNGKLQMIINYSDNTVNHIKLDLGIDMEPSFGVTRFNADQFIGILNANKDAEGQIFVSQAGLLKATFVGDGFSSEYYLVALSGE